MSSAWDGYTCMACGEKHLGSGNLPCPNRPLMAAVSLDLESFTDRELLEMATRACGIEDGVMINGVGPHGGTWWDHQHDIGVYVHDDHPQFSKPACKGVSNYRMRDGGVGWLWNPLTNEGDRYRLLSSMKISLDFADGCAWKRLPSGQLVQEFFGGDYSDEAHAIVRAAIKSRAMLMVQHAG